MELPPPRSARPEGPAPDLRRAVTVLMVALAVVVGAAFYLNGPESTAAVLLYLAVVWGAAVLAWSGYRRTRSSTAALVCFAVVSNALGDTLWTYLEWSGPTPDVSSADAFYLSSYVAIAWALFALLRRGAGRGSDNDAVLDAVTMVLIAVMVMWTVSVQDIVTDASVSVFVSAVWAAYPVMDAVLIALAARFLTAVRPLDRHAVALVGGLVLWLFSDLGYLLTAASGGWAGSLEIGWMAGAVLIAFGARVPAPALRPAPPMTRRRLHLRVAIAVLPLVVPVSLEVYHDWQEGEPTTAWAVAGMSLLILLAYLRTARVLRSEQRLRDTLHARERRADALAASSSDAIIVVGADGTILQDSPHLAALLRRTEPVPARGLAELLSPADRQRITEAMAHVVGTPGSAVTVEFPVPDAGGDHRWISARMTSLLDDPDVRGVVSALSDVTERKHIEQELEASRDAALEASRAKSAFLANMSHEIRTPMNGVIGLTDLLLTTRLEERQQQYAEGIRSAGSALLTVIDDILDFSKVEAGKLVLETIDFDLSRVVEEVGALVAESASTKRLELLAYCSPEVPLALRGDPSRLRQVMLNLVANAIKFTHEGEVVLSAHLDQASPGRSMVRVEVTDTGIGLDPARAEQLFAPFSQADSSTTRRYGGTGLGLAISRQLVEAMGGEIGVRSTPGQGSTFWFTVPLESALDPGAGPECPVEGLAGTRVLVVDDNATNRLILTEQLGAWQMRPWAVPDAEAALQRLRDAADVGEPFTLVVLDLCMPDVDGLELARRVHAEPRFGHPGMVLLTSGPDITSDEAAAVGITQRLRKPVRLSHLHSALREVLATSLPTAPTAAAPDAAARRGHVLVVEDNEINQLVAGGLLEHLGYSYEIAGNGREALDALDGGSYSAVLMDCQMPELDGYAATRELRRREGATAHVPVIAMTAGVTEGERERCLEAGMDDYVSKPVSITELENALLRWVPAPVR